VGIYRLKKLGKGETIREDIILWPGYAKRTSKTKQETKECISPQKALRQRKKKHLLKRALLRLTSRIHKRRVEPEGEKGKEQNQA